MNDMEWQDWTPILWTPKVTMHLLAVHELLCYHKRCRVEMGRTPAQQSDILFRHEGDLEAVYSISADDLVDTRVELWKPMKAWLRGLHKDAEVSE